MLHGFATSHDGTIIAFEAEGSGPPVVLLHGFAANRACWREKGYVERIVESGRQVIVVDARGHGASGKPHYARAYADHKRAQDLIAVLDTLGHPVADLHGFSMGGWIAIATACTFPRRVRSLSLNGAHGLAQSLEPFRTALRSGLEGWIASVESEMQGDVPLRGVASDHHGPADGEGRAVFRSPQRASWLPPSEACSPSAHFENRT